MREKKEWRRRHSTPMSAATKMSDDAVKATMRPDLRTSTPDLRIIRELNDNGEPRRDGQTGC